MLEQNNEAAKEKQKALAEKNHFINETELHELSKAYPFYGYIKIYISGLEPFVMFSNNDDFVAKTYFWRGIDAYETTSLKIWTALARSASTIIDVGAYTGLYSLAAAKSNKNASIFAFEALDRAYFRLLINKQVNAIPKLKIYHKAISNTDGELVFYIYKEENILTTGSSLLRKDAKKNICEKKKVNTMSLDSWLATSSQSHVDLLKIDAEGAEHLVLQGAQHAIKTHCPDILVEILNSADLQAIQKAVDSQPYSFFRIDDITGSIEEMTSPQPSTGMHNLNTLISCKSKDHLLQLVTDFSKTL